MVTADRRRHPRVRLQQPLRGVIGNARVYILDASISGVRVAHQVALPPPGSFCRVEMPTDVGPIRLDCEIVRTVAERALFHSGLQILSADRQSAERLKEICS